MKKKKNQQNKSDTIIVLRRIKSSVLSSKQLLNINGYITSGPLIQNKKLMQIRGKQFLIAISIAFLLINFIIVDQSQIISYISDDLLDQVDTKIDINSFQLYCNIPNVIVPLFMGYLSDYISIGYLLMITLGVNFLSNVTLSLFLIKGDLELYLLTQILWQMANEGIQNACFNLLYEYSSISKKQTVYYSIFTIFGYCIPRSIPLISNIFLSQPDSGYRDSILEYKDYYAYMYLTLTVISTSLLLLVVRKNHNKELEEQLLDMRYYMVRLSPAQKPTLYQAVKRIIVWNKPLMKQFFFSAILVGISSVMMGFKFFSSVLQIKGINFTYQPYMYSKSNFIIKDLAYDTF